MHERALVSKAVLDLATRLGQERVSRVRVALNPETKREVVEEAWRSAAVDTIVAGATVDYFTVSHGLQCLQCGAQYCGDKLTLCPTCGGNGLIVNPTPEVSVESWLTEARL